MTGDSGIVWGAVIVAAGRSERFGDTDKLLMDLNGRPIIAWSIRTFLSIARFRQIVVVVSPENARMIGQLVELEHLSPGVTVCEGGATRSESVRRGLDVLSSCITYVAIHDGARPLAAPALVERVLDAAERNGAAIPGVNIVGSVGVAAGDGRKLAGHISREQLRELQTPQASRRTSLIDAMNRFPNETDESSALFRAGYDVDLVEGDPVNIKITVASDADLAAALLASREAPG